MRVDAMKSGLKLMIIVILLSCMSACAQDEPFYRGFSRGIYIGSQQYQDSKLHPATLSPDDRLPSYEEYERQRKEHLEKDEGQVQPP